MTSQPRCLQTAHIHICLSTASWRPAVHICNQPTHACCLFRAHEQPMVTGVLLSVDQSRGTVYLWHCVQVTSRRRLSEDVWRHFCLTVLTINRWRTVVSGTWKYDDPMLNMSHEGATRVWHVQPRVVLFPCPTNDCVSYVLSSDQLNKFFRLSAYRTLYL